MERWLIQNQDSREITGQYNVTHKNKLPLSSFEFLDWLINHHDIIFNFREDSNKLLKLEIYSYKYGGDILMRVIIPRKYDGNIDATKIHNNKMVNEILSEYCDESLKYKVDTVIYNNINQRIENLYNLSLVESNYKELGNGLVKITLESPKNLSAKNEIQYLRNRRRNDIKVATIINKYLKIPDIKARINNIESQYLFEKYGYLKVILTINLKFYTNEVYSATYGIMEYRIRNICTQGLGSVTKEIEQIAKELQLNTEGLNDDEICTTLWNIFYRLTDDDFEYFSV